MKTLIILGLLSLPTFAMGLDFPAKTVFREPNTQATPFSLSHDPVAIEQERFGPGWRFIEAKVAASHRYVVFNHGTGFRNEPYPTRVQPGRGNDLNKIAKWYAAQGINFYAPLSKNVKYRGEFEKGDYRDIEAIESAYHTANYILANDPNAVICFVGHSEGAVVPLNTSTVLTEPSRFRHVSSSPRHGYDTGSEWSKQHFKKSGFRTARNLIITMGSKEKTDKTLTEYETLPQQNPSIQFEVHEGFDHKTISKSSTVDRWGPIMIKACGF